MAGTLGTIIGQIRIDITQASAAYAAIRAQHAATVSALNGSAVAFNKAGLAMVAAGALMVGAFVKAVSSAAEFEKRLDFFGAVSNSTAAQMEKVRAKALQLGQDTKYSANQIADSFVELGKAGISAEQIIGGVGEAVTNLGAAADIPLVDAANIITAAVQVFSLKAKDAIHVADLLAGAANASIVEVADLGVSLKYVGGVAAAVHIPIESVIDALSLLGKAGIRGSTAGTSLRQILVSLQGTSKKATEKLKELGIITADGSNKFINAQGHVKPLAEVFQILQDHTRDLTEAQRLMAFKVIFNNRALAAASILTQAGAKGFADMNAEISKTTAADVAAKRMDNLSGDIEILRGNVETLLIKAGTPFQNFLRGIVQGITGIVQAFSSLPSGVQTGIFAFLGIAGSALLMIGAFNLIVGSVLNFASILLRLNAAFKFLLPTLKALRVAILAMNTAFLTNPIVWIVIAVIALVAGFILLYKHSETFRNIIGAIGKFFVSVWNGVLAFFRGVPGFFSNLWASITGAFSAAIDWIKSNWKNILFIIMGPLGLIIGNVGGFRDKIVSFFSNLWETAKTVTMNGINAVINFFATLPERVAYWIGFLVGRTIKLWYDLQVFLITNTIKIVMGIVEWISQLPSRIANFITDTVNRGIALWQQFYNKLVSVTVSLFNAVVNWISQLPGRIAAFITNTVNRGIQLWQQFYSASVSLAQRLVSGVISFIQNLPGMIANFFTNMYNRAVSILSAMVSRAAALASSLRNAISNGIAAIPGLISGVFQRALNALSGLARAAWSRAQSIGSSLWNGFKDGMGINSPSYIEKAMFALTKTMDEETAKTAKSVKVMQRLGSSLVKKNPVSAYASALDAGLPATPSASLRSAALAASGPTIAANLPIPRQRGGSQGGPNDPTNGASGAPLIGTQNVYNPVAEPGSQTAARQSRRAALIGGTR